MIGRWIAPMTLDHFVREHLGKLPASSAGGASDAVPLFDWTVLDRVLRRVAHDEDVLVVERGRVTDSQRPTGAGAVRSLFAKGEGIVIQRAERLDPGLKALAEAIEAELGGSVHLQLFVTPGGTHGFGWHFDLEEVFIVQTLGSKTYYFRENTETRDPAEFGRIENESTPIMSATLVPGDWLYIPSPFWHIAIASDDSLSISIGINRERDQVFARWCVT